MLTVRSHVPSSCFLAERMARHVTREGAYLSTKQSSAVANGFKDGLCAGGPSPYQKLNGLTISIGVSFLYSTTSLRNPWAYGTVCFGDIELRGDDTLLVSGLSDAHMEVLLDLLRPLKLGTPKVQRDPFPRLEKPGRKTPSWKRRRVR